MITITNSKFDAQGSAIKDKVYGLRLSGKEDVMIQNCEFANKGYASILNNCEGSVTVKDCKFNCENVYNPIEGSQAVDNGNLAVEDCEFAGKPGNNYLNLYQVADGSEHKVVGCSFNPSVDNNVIRVSNRTSAGMKIDVVDCKYDFLPGEASDYTGFLLCQDYTNKSGVKQDFSKVEVKVKNLLCNGEKVTAEGANVGCVYYVYEDGVGLITGENDPKFVFVD